MTLKLSVPTLTQATAQDLEETILTSQPDAKIQINPDQKTVTIEAQASEETFKQLITAAGHKIA